MRTFKTVYSLLVVALLIVIGGCSDEKEKVLPLVSVGEGQQNKQVAWDAIEASVKFAATAAWSVTIEDMTESTGNSGVTWIKLPRYKGEAGDVSLPMLFQKNDSENEREAAMTIVCGESKSIVKIRQEANPNAVLTMNPADILDYDKFYMPGTHNEGFEKGSGNMLRSDARWSWWRMKQSEHFFVFWEPGFGDDPNAETVPEVLRVDVDDLLRKAEQFYKTNVEKLKFAEVGVNKSYLDKYKMEIYLFYQTEWLATGSGYDNTIGALWVNPSTCKPVGSTIAHEIGHSFQYQVGCDKVLNGLSDFSKVGFRYGYGPNGEGGNAFWEQCAQWQSFQDYPEELFGYHVDVWKANYHRHFSHEWMRYASYWLQYYWKQKHGADVVGQIWTQAQFPEDALMAYRRIYCGGSSDKLYEELYDYATRMVTYDIDVIRNHVKEAAKRYATKLFEVGDGYYQVGYASCPGTTGFNIIPLNLPKEAAAIKVAFAGLPSGSALADTDPGRIQDGDGKEIGTTRKYNNSDAVGGWRYGFVSIVNGKARYSAMYKESKSEVYYQVPEGATALYMVVMGALEAYAPHPWNDDETDDAQWPYKVKFEGTDLLGSFYVDETAAPKNITLTYDLKCDYKNTGYALGTIDLALNQSLAQAFALKPSALAGRLTPIGEEPAEGKIAIALEQPDGTYAYRSTANNGFWCTPQGMNDSWKAGNVFLEFADLVLTYGNHPEGETLVGTKAVLKPVLIYTKEGIQYKATIVLNMQF